MIAYVDQPGLVIVQPFVVLAVFRRNLSHNTRNDPSVSVCYVSRERPRSCLPAISQR